MELTPVQFDAARRLAWRHNHAWADVARDWPVRAWSVEEIEEAVIAAYGTEDCANYTRPVLEGGAVVESTTTGRLRWSVTRDGEVTLTVERPRRGSEGGGRPGCPVLRARLFVATDRANALALLAGEGMAFTIASVESLSHDWGDRHLEALTWSLHPFLSGHEIQDLVWSLLVEQEVERKIPSEGLCLLQDRLEGVRAPGCR